MEFNFDCIQSLDCDKDGFSILEGSYQNRIVPGYILFVKEILNMMGEASSKAQGLQTIITSADKFFSSNHRIFIKAEKNKVLGFIKVGNKKLFLRDRNYNYHEVYPLCVLDFYVHESTQRRGIGKQLFDYMIKFEKKSPKELAYDRPSPKLISFLRKYFGLQGFIQQNNNFVVFDDFFSLIPSNINTTVVIKLVGKKQVVEVTINTHSFVIRGEESNNDLYASIDLVSDKIERQIRKNKTRMHKKINKDKIKDFNLEYEVENEEKSDVIVKRKVIETKPMDEEEAILQMELLGHDFFVFKNANTDEFNILYKRKDGDYGIIETK